MILVADMAVGLIAVTAIAATPLLVTRLDLSSAFPWGVPLVLVLPLVVAVGPTSGAPGFDEALFIFGVIAFAVGSAIIVSSFDGGSDDAGGDPGPLSDPPWWPDFERDFRHYERGQRVRT